MGASEDIISQLPIDQIAAQVGADPAQVQSAVQQAVPTLLGGLQANAADPDGAASLTEALSQHQDRDPASVSGAEADKMVSHIFGANEPQVVSQLGGLGGGNDLIKKLLPILAPIVLQYLAGKVLGGFTATAGTAQGGATAGGLGNILGSILGGGALGGGTQAGGAAPGSGVGLPGGLGEILGGLLGGGRKA
ncbi:DUF937 domain-containing protein [Flexivirga oryzae]|uniref:DUF937 domain-containing protein n=1 Tax=Flexivirga oryzae TaxID=1794944 RepID=A0A839N4X2_9MICO|nr:DUF937 domain-containing protein [Flexivirga oryzae]MBB2892347.1 hypothetical protein [Flexivirga oryzae]